MSGAQLATSSPPPVAAPPWRVPRWVDKACLAAGLGLLGYVISRVPLAELARACVRIGPLIAVTPLIALGWIACNTSALHLLLDRRVPWLQLLRIRLIGDGYNALLPLGGMGGEPFKIKHLSRYVPTDRLLTALIRDRVIENAVGLLYTAVWLAIAVGRFTMGNRFRGVVVVYVAIAAVVGVVSALLVVTSLPSKAGALLGKWLGVASQSGATLPPLQFARVLLWFVAARVVGCLELTVLFLALGLGFDPVTVLFSYSLLQAAGFIGFAIPAGLGVFEGTTVFLFSVLGFPAALGVAVALARRARMLIVGLLGVMLHVFFRPSRSDPAT